MPPCGRYRNLAARLDELAEFVITGTTPRIRRPVVVRPAAPASPDRAGGNRGNCGVVRDPDVRKRRWTPRPVGDHVAIASAVTPLIRAWCDGVEGNAILSRPSTRYLHNGRDLSSGRAANRAISSCSCSSLPGDGGADAGRGSDVEVASSIHTGLARPNFTSWTF